VPLLIAMDLLGFDLTDEQRLEIENLLAPPPVMQISTPPQAQLPAPQEQAQLTDGSPATYQALQAWQRKALKRLKESGSAACEFISVEISQENNERISLALKSCKTIDEVKDLFAIREDTSISVAEELSRAISWLEAHESANA
jgi:hypothetical protein